MVYDHLSPALGAHTAVVETHSVEQQIRDVFVVLREPVYRYLCGVLGDRAEAEDLTQEAFMRLHHSLQSGDAISNFRAWVFRVAHNLAINSFTRHRHETTDPLPAGGDGLRSPALNVEEDIMEREERAGREAWFSQALDKLSPQERHCLELRAEGLRYREIAEILGVRVPTVQTFLARAVSKMVRPGVRE